MNPKELFEQSGKRFFFVNPSAIAEYVWKNYPDHAQTVIATADDVATQRFMFTLRWDMERTNEPVIFEGDINWLYQPGDDPEWVFAFNRMRFWICLGQAYALTGDEKYADAFVQQLTGWVETVPNIKENEKAWRSIEVGLRLEYWLKAMQYFKNSPAITPQVAQIFVQSVTEQAELIMGIWNTYNLMSNWGVLANHGLFMAGGMLPQTPRTEEYVKEAIRRLEAEINMQVYRDGSHWEQSPMYHNEVLHCFLDVLLLAQRCGIQLPKVLTDNTLSMCLYDVVSAKPDHSEPMMGDSDDIDQRDQITKGAVIFNNPALKARGYEVPDFDTIWDIGEEGLKIHGSLTASLPEKTDFWLPDSGNAFFRSGWGEKDAWVHFQCGPLGAGHGHADKLHLDISSRGEDILTDAGRYSYVAGPKRIGFKELRAHNTIMVDGQDLYVCKDSWECDRLTRAVNNRFYSDERYGYAEGGHLGYMDLPKGVYLNRRVILIKPDIVVLADEFYSSGAHFYNQFFHFAECGELMKVDAARWHYARGNASARICFMGEGSTAKAVDTKISRHYNVKTQAKGIVTSFAAEGSGCVFTVISLGDIKDARDLSVKKLAVRSTFKDVLFSDNQIEALDIRLGDLHYTVVVAHMEYASPTDTFHAGGCIGFGNAVVFDRREGETETGTVLVW
jgi:hypothetical protein